MPEQSGEKKRRRIAIAGGGAAGFFAAITAAQADPDADIRLFEKSSQFLGKVRISGGGRCNVTHACFEPRALSQRYPRGERALISAFNRFQPADTLEWFAQRGVRLKTEADGRMFPVTNSSETIVECLLEAARAHRVGLSSKLGVENAVRESNGEFLLTLTNGETLACDALLLATGGCRTPAAGMLAESLGHSIVDPVPSLFTFHIEAKWLKPLPGVAVEDVEAEVPGTGLRERGPLLVTHWGLSGPVILRLSAWGARTLGEKAYRFPLRIRWLPDLSMEAITARFQEQREVQSAKRVMNTPLAGLPARLWEELAKLAGIRAETKWNHLSRANARQLAALLHSTELPVTGKSLNKDEFVTCGGVPLKEVDFKTMESRVCPGLHFAGEVLDVDGITGGFNFQAAWTTGWIAGNALASRTSNPASLP